MNNIVLLAVWFGPLPKHFPLWVESAGHNAFVDFVLVTDQSYQVQAARNVTIVPDDKQGYSARVARFLKKDFELKNPYKLCDLKVLLSKLYPEWVAEREWWGYCDLDIVWGNLSLDLNDATLKNYDKIGLSAHCSLWRRGDYDHVLSVISTEEYLQKLGDAHCNYALDEYRGLGNFYSLKPCIYSFRNELNFDTNSGRLVPANYNRRDRDSFFWRNGEVIWREYTERGYYDTRHSYMHFPRQNMRFTAGSPKNDDTIYMIRHGSITAEQARTCDQPTNHYSRSVLLENFRRRIAFTARNRLNGGTRSRVVLK